MWLVYLFEIGIYKKKVSNKDGLEMFSCVY